MSSEHMGVWLTYNAKHGSVKFAQRWIPCMFLGYPNGTKGYRVLNLETKELMISRHVQFHENVFPLNKNVETEYVQPLPTPIVVQNKFVEDELEPEKSDVKGEEENNTEDEGSQSNEESNSEMEKVQPLRSTRLTKQPIWMQDFVTPASKTVIGKAMSAAAVMSQNMSSNITDFLPQSYQKLIQHHSVKLSKSNIG